MLGTLEVIGVIVGSIALMRGIDEFGKDLFRWVMIKTHRWEKCETCNGNGVYRIKRIKKSDK